MHIHLDPVGGAAGDMFAAAMLDLRPDLEPGLQQALHEAGFSSIVSVAHKPFSDGILSGSQFDVLPSETERHDHQHRHYTQVVKLFNDASMSEAVRLRALDIFRVLGEAEAHVHGKPLAEVAFHEVGAWDSIADVMSAAWLIDAIGAQSWSCAAIPIGGGRVQTAHGELALPAPATTYLLRGFPMLDDGRMGERVTPTGAAILKHLQPRFETLDSPMTLLGSGSGFGTRKMRDMSNVLRVLCFESTGNDPAGQETITVCEFEVDDQTPEDLAVGLDNIRALGNVLDVLQAPVVGKKGRMAMHVRVLAHTSNTDEVLAACLSQTTTLGVRWHQVQRSVLAREAFATSIDGQNVRLKQVTRPSAQAGADEVITRKAEMDDVAMQAHTHNQREHLRRIAETAATSLNDDKND